MNKTNLDSIATKMSDKEMKAVKGGSVPPPEHDTFRLADNGGGGGGGCGNASEACASKKDGDYCESGSSCSPGTCRYAPIAGLICWRN